MVVPDRIGVTRSEPPRVTITRGGSLSGVNPPDGMLVNMTESQLDWITMLDRGTDAPIVGSDDPWESHVAAERIQPQRDTRKFHVLRALRRRHGEWLPGHVFTQPEVGGSEGLRRLRELRADGWPIERRPSPKSASSWEYRLTLEGP